MSSKNYSAKDNIFKAALELVASEENIEGITSRQIAQKANVNLALINYYYKSKENLMSQVAQVRMTAIIAQVLDHGTEDVDAATKLKMILTTTADFSFKHNEIFRIAVAQELKEGCTNSCELVMPFIKAICKGKNDAELKIIALQLMLPFHNIVLYPKAYGSYLNTDFFDIKQRTHKINEMTDSILLKA